MNLSQEQTLGSVPKFGFVAAKITVPVARMASREATQASVKLGRVFASHHETMCGAVPRAKINYQQLITACHRLRPQGAIFVGWWRLTGGAGDADRGRARDHTGLRSRDPRWRAAARRASSDDGQRPANA
jgi:hypothetical protein